MNRPSIVRTTRIIGIVLGSTLAFSIMTLAQNNHSTRGAAQADRGYGNSDRTSEGRVARGKYIVEGMAVCGQCHTPRTSSGKLDDTRWLEGAPLWLPPSTPSANWPIEAPRLAGSPPGSDADLITLLTTGVWRDRQRLRPPMPVFHMSSEDAQAVVAYLRSLSPPYGVR
jgi:mono/diheme cytochrome c family protein